jgi:hypothetical protein
MGGFSAALMMCMMSLLCSGCLGSPGDGFGMSRILAASQMILKMLCQNQVKIDILMMMSMHLRNIDLKKMTGLYSSRTKY